MPTKIIVTSITIKRGRMTAGQMIILDDQQTNLRIAYMLTAVLIQELSWLLCILAAL